MPELPLINRNVEIVNERGEPINADCYGFEIGGSKVGGVVFVTIRMAALSVKIDKESSRIVLCQSQ